VEEMYQRALQWLARRDYTVHQMRRKLTAEFGAAPQAVLDRLIEARLLDDRRFAEQIILKKRDNHASRLRDVMAQAGISEEAADQALASWTPPSLQEVLKAKMISWRLDPPLDRRDAARLFRALRRLGYPEDEINEEIDQLHEQ